MSPENMKTIPFFKYSSVQFLNAMSLHAVTQPQPKGKILFLSGEDVSRFFYINSGWVKLYKETLDGEQAIIDILHAGQVFGENAIFDDNTAAYSAEIIEDAQITAFPLKDLKAELESNNQMALHLIRLLNSHNKNQEKEIEHRTLQDAPQRIGCFILRLCPENQEEDVVIRLPYDKTLIAARLGMQPETFSRALSKLKGATNIEVHGATIVIPSVEELSLYVCAACSSEFPCKDLTCASNGTACSGKC